MPSRKQELVSAWLAKADHDLEAARVLITGSKRLLDVGVYHCQQAAEKSLKGWLTSREIIFPKTHSLEVLLLLCIPSTAAFAQFQGSAEELTPLAHEFRYPGDISEPGFDQATRALGLAEEIYNFCQQQIETERR